MKGLYGLNFMLLSAMAIANSNCKTPEQSRPNILYIMCDDHSHQTISAYGSAVSHLAPTPNIDRIANEGMRFDRAFVENSLSAPSRACLMTGYIAIRMGNNSCVKE